MTATETLPLSGQALHHLDEMAEHQHQHHCDLSGLAWGFLHILDHTPPSGVRFEGLWSEYVRVSAGLRAALPDGDWWTWRQGVRRTLTALAGEAQ